MQIVLDYLIHGCTLNMINKLCFNLLYVIISTHIFNIRPCRLICYRQLIILVCGQCISTCISSVCKPNFTGSSFSVIFIITRFQFFETVTVNILSQTHCVIKFFFLMSINFMISTPYIEIVIYVNSQRIGKTMLYQHVFVLVHVLPLPVKRIHIRITSCKSVMSPLCTLALGVVLVFYSNRHHRSATCSQILAAQRMYPWRSDVFFIIFSYQCISDLFFIIFMHK